MNDFLKEMKQFRCPICNKLLFKYRIKGSLRLEIKCTRCDSDISSILGEANGTNED